MPTKAKSKKAADLNPAFEQSDLAQAIVKGHTVERRMDYGRIVVDGRTVGQVAARKDYVVLERLHEDTNVPAALEPTGKDGKIRGRFKVTAKQVSLARKAIDASAKLVANDVADKTTSQAETKPSTKDRVLTGKLAEVAAANPDLAEQGKDVKPTRKKVGEKAFA